MGWCQLRQLAIHGDLASDLWCHHWTPRPPRLPVPGATAARGNRQLSLDAALSSGLGPQRPAHVNDFNQLPAL